MSETAEIVLSYDLMTKAVTAKRDDDVLHVDKFDIRKASARARFAAALAKDRDGIDSVAIEVELLRLAGDAAKPQTTHKPRPDGAPEVSADDRAEALVMLRDPELVRIIVDDIASLGVAGEKGLAATLYLVGTSRLLPKPLAAIVQGLTSSGKSYVVDTVGRLFPPEAVLHAQRMTPQALYHLSPGALEHRFIVAGERSRKQDDDTADATRALREMLSDGKLTKLIPEKRADGRIETVHIEQPGPIAYVESTTLQKILDEDANRCIVLATDETPEQTRRIVESIAARKAGIGEGVNADDVLRRHHAAQRILRPYTVMIPFAPRLGELFPKERTDSRRTFGHVLAVVEASALLHQYQRVAEPADGAAITATRDDYVLARRLVAEPIARSLGSGVSPAAERFAERLRTVFGESEFSSRDVKSAEGVIGDVQTIRGYLRVLADAGVLEQVSESRGQRPAQYKMVMVCDDATRAGLPTVEDIFEDVDSSARLRVKAQPVAV